MHRPVSRVSQPDQLKAPIGLSEQERQYPEFYGREERPARAEGDSSLLPILGMIPPILGTHKQPPGSFLTSSLPFPILPEATEQIPKLAGSCVSLDPSTPHQDPTQAKHSNLLQGKCLP